MKRFALILALVILSLTAMSCGAGNDGSRQLSIIPGENMPSAAAVEAAWNDNAASHNFDSIDHVSTFGELYNGSAFTNDMYQLGMDINSDLNYNTGIQSEGAGVLFCEFTGDGCKIPPKK